MEEEYFVFDAKTRRAVRHMSRKLLTPRREQLGDHVMTARCCNKQKSRWRRRPASDNERGAEHLVHYRRTLAPNASPAAERQLGLAAMGTFPLAFWPEQIVTPKAPLLGAIIDNLRMIRIRNMYAALRVHVQVPDIDRRVDLIMRLTPYLPLLLALSTSSPFWPGHLHGLVGYRLAAYDELPRTGLPELFRTNDNYNENVTALTRAKIIPDASYIWWALRRRWEIRPSNCASPTVAPGSTMPSRSPPFPLLGARARPSRPRTQSGFDRVGRAMTVEQWHAQRYGIAATSSIRFPAPRSRSSNGSIRSSISSPRISTRPVVQPTFRRLHRIVAEGTSADHAIDLFLESQSHRSQAADRYQGSRRLGGARNPGRGPEEHVKPSRSGLPLAARATYKRANVQRAIDHENARQPPGSWLRPSTSSTDRI